MTQLSLSYCSSRLQFCREPKLLVPKAGLEPARLSTPDFESGTSANSIIRAYRIQEGALLFRSITGFETTSKFLKDQRIFVGIIL